MSLQFIKAGRFHDALDELDLYVDAFFVSKETKELNYSDQYSYFA